MRLFLSLAAAVLILLLTSTAPAEEEIKKTPVIEDITSAELKSIISVDGEHFTMINVWASWCGPCREEFPDLLKIRQEFMTDGLSFIFISTDFERQIDHARDFLQQQGVDFTTYRKAEDDETFINSLNPKWGGALPTTLLYNRQGNLQQYWVGKVTYETLEAEVKKILK